MLKLPSIFYGWGIALRNFAFDIGLLRSEKPSIPTICVGNLSVGGTGKTPHIEMLIRHLQGSCRVAVLSRGYGRTTSDPLIAHPHSTAEEIGDEPAQIIRKFPDLLLLVDGDRMRAIRRLERLPEGERPDVILMDDGYQHRYVKPAYSILLTPYHSPFTRDSLLPYGNLREHESGKFRADTIIVTGTPKGLRPLDFSLLKSELDLLAHQDLFFSRVAYMPPRSLFALPEVSISASTPLVLLSGIAHPEAFYAHAEEYFQEIRSKVTYPDHHMFKSQDLNSLFAYLDQDPEVQILCTEKDGMRLLALEHQIPTEYRCRFFVWPIYIDMSPETTRRFMSRVTTAIQNNGLEMV